MCESGSARDDVDARRQRTMRTPSSFQGDRNKTGEAFIVNGDDPYANPYEPGRKIGIELGDG